MVHNGYATCTAGSIELVDPAEEGVGVRVKRTKPRSRQEFCVAGQDHEQVKDVPGIAQVSPRATAGPCPQQKLQCEEGIEAQLCNTQVIILCSSACCNRTNNKRAARTDL